VKLFSLKNFILSLSEAPKAHYFCFLLLIQCSAVQQKSNKATSPNTKSFFYCKTRVVRTRYVYYFTIIFQFSTSVITAGKIRIICGRCQITIPGHLRVMLQRVRSISYHPVLKTKRSGRTAGKCSLLWWRINHFALNLSRVCLNIIEINKFQIFVPSTLHAKLTLMKVLVHLRLNLTQPY